MAFNFFGTFTTGQWEEFRSFSIIQKADLFKRKEWLQAQLYRNGMFETTYDDDNNPISFKCNVGSYGAKLLEAYKILGGVPESDMLLRTIDKPVFLEKSHKIEVEGNGNATGGFSGNYSNGRKSRGTMRFDRSIGVMIESSKNWQLNIIKNKRERLEYKIKRCLDYSSQLAQEINTIEKLLNADDRKSFANVMSNVELAMLDGTMSVIDNTDDKFGLGISRAGDMAFPDAVSEAYEKDERIPTSIQTSKK